MSEDFELHKYGLSVEDAQNLPEDQLAAFGVFCFACSEINVLHRLYICSVHPPHKDQEIRFAALIQQFLILRTWTAKLFEVTEFVKFEGKYNKTKDPVLKEFSTEALNQLQKIQDEAGNGLAKKLRDEVANHYHLKPARANVAHLSEVGEYSMYLHKAAGNSFYPFGEELMFGARLNRFEADNPNKDANLFKEWNAWNVKVSRWVSSMHVRLFEMTLKKLNPERAAEIKSYSLPDNMFMDHRELLVPLFIKPELK
ncbi:MAG: hypothetical protein AAF231_02735 [Pseudomonadota bacterium]